jgi:hypothetical protein
MATGALTATGCTKTPHSVFHRPTTLAAGQTNLLGNPSFETPFHFCDINCNRAWSSEYTTIGTPEFYPSSAGRVTGQLAETISYRGRRGDDGKTQSHDRAIEVFQSVTSGKATAAGQAVTFTIWVSGHCSRCVPFIGIEAFDSAKNWLGEQDQYFRVPKSPSPEQETWVLPGGTTRVAALFQVPEIYQTSNVDVHIDNALLVSRQATVEELAAATKDPRGNG